MDVTELGRRKWGYRKSFQKILINNWNFFLKDFQLLNHISLYDCLSRARALRRPVILLELH